MKRIMALAGLLALAACDDGKVKEIARYPSPVGGLDVVVGRLSAGESDPFLVEMSKTGDAAGKGARLLLADRTDAPVVEWADAEHLTIRCGNARIWTFRNFWTSPNAKQVTVSVKLECGREGWTP
jgi:hypothetical protein